MLWKIRIIFLLYMAIGLCEMKVELKQHIYEIRNDYCQDYYQNLNCTNNGTTVNTDEYKIELMDGVITLTWKNNLMNISHLKYLNLSQNKICANQLEIKFDETWTGNTFAPSSRYLKALNLYTVDLILMKNVREFGVHVSRGPEKVFMAYLEEMKNPSTFFNNYLSTSMNNLRKIYISCNGTLIFRKDTFKNNAQLERISFYNSKLKNLTSDTFESLINLKSLQFFRCTLDNESFLRSDVLRNNLELLAVDMSHGINFDYFKEFRNLKTISVTDKNNLYTKQISETNLTFIICDFSYSNLCHFNIGINGKHCPSECKCGLDAPRDFFIINCTRQGRNELPELPKPVTGNVSLYFEGNGLTQLPNTSLAGYSNVQELHLAHNNLGGITIDQLPENITYLDISYNNITSLDPKVAQFLLERMDKTAVLQLGIYWKCDCKNRDLMRYLEVLRERKTMLIENNAYKSADFRAIGLDVAPNRIIDNSVYYYHLNGTCPDSCTCCVNGTQFIINCTNKALRTFPQLPTHISGISLLLLDYNLIEHLPIVSLQNSTLGALYIKNNSLTDLKMDHLPSKIRALDIRGNKLTGLDDEVTLFISKLVKIQLSGNPWQCSCKFVKFLKYLKKEHSLEYIAALRHCSGQEYCPKECICCKEDYSLRFVIDCSRKKLTEIPLIPKTENASLLFEHNRLTYLNKSSIIEGFHQLIELHLKNNRIEELDYIPDNIQLLDVRNNYLSKLSGNITRFLTKKSDLSSLTLFISGNSWICNCREMHFFRFAKSLARNINDLCLTQCSDSSFFVMLEEKDVCPPEIPSYVIIFTSFIILTIILSYLQCYCKSIRMWLYEKGLFIRLTARREVDFDTKYDCFLAYCHKDSHLTREYVERLENGRSRLRLCFYERDWLAGEPIPDCISNSVESSKCTVIIMTDHFLKSVWGRLEFRMALYVTSKDPNKRLVVIVYPGVENFDELDGELQGYMKLNTYLMRSDANFWNKLIYALPHKTIDYI